MKQSADEGQDIGAGAILEGFSRLARSTEAQLDADVLLTSGLTRDQIETLRVARALREAMPADVARQLRCSVTTARRLLDRLVDRGLVERRPLAHAKKLVVYRVHERGGVLLRDAETHLERAVGNVLRTMPPLAGHVLLMMLQMLHRTDVATPSRTTPTSPSSAAGMQRRSTRSSRDEADALALSENAKARTSREDADATVGRDATAADADAVSLGEALAAE